MPTPDDPVAAAETTVSSGPVGPSSSEKPGSPPKGADLARAALARAREEARARSAATARRTRATERERKAEGGGERASGEPLAFGSAVRELLDQRGWNAEAAAAKVLANWEALVGSEIAAASKPVRLRHGELLVEAESTAWATQLRLLNRMILDRIVAELGPDVVRKIVVRGPTAPDWRHGRLRVQGPGPRDTYG